MAEPFRIEVTLTNSDYVRRLEGKIQDLQKQLKASQEHCRDLEYRYGNELHINLELTDILRNNGIRFRPTLDNRNW